MTQQVYLVMCFRSSLMTLKFCGLMPFYTGFILNLQLRSFHHAVVPGGLVVDPLLFGTGPGPELLWPQLLPILSNRETEKEDGPSL